MKKIIGPKIESCETPLEKFDNLECWLLTTTVDLSFTK